MPWRFYKTQHEGSRWAFHGQETLYYARSITQGFNSGDGLDEISFP